MLSKANRLLAGFLAILMVTAILPAGIFAAEPDLTISTLAELQSFAADVRGGNTYEGKTVVLTADIALGGEETPWTPIGNASNKFEGTFDGNGHIISDLYINSTEANQGLFGYVNGGTVKNCVVQGSVVSTKGYVAGIVGYNNKGTIENCMSTVDVNGSGGSFVHYYDGIAGYSNGTVTGCVNGGSITATGGSACGGVVGCNFGGTVTNSYNKGNVSNPGSHVGGVVGQSRQSGAKVENCYNIGAVSGNTNVGAVVGQDQSSSCSNSLYLSGSSAYGVGSPSDSIGVMTESELKSAAATLGSAYIADTDSINGGYPILTWQVRERVPDLIISTYDGLKNFADSVNGGNSYEGKLIRLDVNISLGGESNPWTPIGTSSTISFKGTFDGNYHVISDLYINSTAANQGLFGYVSGGTVENLAVDGSISGSSNVAGIIGYLNAGTVKNCRNGVNVTGQSAVGGVAGYVGGASLVSECCNTGVVTGTTGYIGGVTGQHWRAGEVKNC